MKAKYVLNEGRRNYSEGYLRQQIYKELDQGDIRSEDDLKSSIHFWKNNKRKISGLSDMDIVSIAYNVWDSYEEEADQFLEGFQGDGDEKDGMSGFRGDFKGDTPADQGMRAARKDNYPPDAETMLEKAFKGLGITIDDDGIIHPTNKLAKILCNMAVSDGKFEKVADDAYVAI